MNRLIFNSGGQPVYLDDLKLLQDNDADAMKALTAALGGSTAFLLSKPEVTDTSVDPTTAVTTFTLKAGILVVDGEFLSWTDTRLSISEWDTPIYLCVRESDTDSRLFEDGQSRNCLKKREAYASKDHTGVSVFYNIYELPTLTDVLAKTVGVEETAWQALSVDFKNGYNGTVKYQDLPECYRVWVSLKSTSTAAITGQVLLFSTAAPFLQFFQSPTKAYVQGQTGLVSFSLVGFNGSIRADVSLPENGISSPDALPVKLVFEIAK